MRTQGAAYLSAGERGLSGAVVAYLCVCAYFLASGLRSCLAAGDPAFALYYMLWGPAIGYYITAPVMLIAFGIGYFVGLRFTRRKFIVWALALLVLPLGIGYTVPVTGCSPL